MKKSIKRLLIVAMAIMISASTAVSAYAVTPTLKPPKLPTAPEIKVEVELSDNFWSNWFKEHPLNIDFSKINFG